MLRPAQTDYNPYYKGYIELVTGDNIVQFLEDQKNNTEKLLRSISEKDSLYSYDTGKWTIKQVVGHVIDVEKIMAYRALCIARKEKQPLPGFEQEDYAVTANFNSRKYSELVNELKLVREANLPMIRSFDEEMISQAGTVDNKRVTVLALLFIIAGHQEHHLKIIRERYLNNIITMSTK
ncbi:MAG TPA: DinB family protein [Ignavibacteriaceae bacterium]|nr:DinB family protein [Ignavibacteriaceae bacterium]